MYALQALADYAMTVDLAAKHLATSLELIIPTFEVGHLQADVSATAVDDVLRSWDRHCIIQRYFGSLSSSSKKLEMPSAKTGGMDASPLSTPLTARKLWRLRRQGHEPTFGIGTLQLIMGSLRSAWKIQRANCRIGGSGPRKK